MKVLTEISARHIHLAQADLEKLFGEGYELTPVNALSQPGEFSAQETLTVVGSKRNLEKVRIIGPIRKQTQIEISKTDSYFLGMEVPLRISGDLEGTPGVTLIGPRGQVKLNQGVIVAKRHLHIQTQDAEIARLKTGDVIKLKIEGERGLVFDNIAVRVNDNYATSVHLDTDEGNAAGINKQTEAEIIKD